MHFLCCNSLWCCYRHLSYPRFQQMITQFAYPSPILNNNTQNWVPLVIISLASTICLSLPANSMNVLQICGYELAVMTLWPSGHLQGLTAWLVAVSNVNLANVLQICAVHMMWMPFPLSYKYYGYFIILFVGVGCLSQGKGRAKRKVLSKKRVPTDRYVLGS